jgi:hypothetical protein
LLHKAKISYILKRREYIPAGRRILIKRKEVSSTHGNTGTSYAAKECKSAADTCIVSFLLQSYFFDKGNILIL